jgi:DNA polymerase I-like protein with 3'-5' exonuclease and polymerase domains
LKIPVAAGPAKGMFNTLLKFGFEKKGYVTNKKISNQEAQRLLDKYFKQDLTGVYAEINKFREGVKSLEVYSS